MGWYLSAIWQVPPDVAPSLSPSPLCGSPSLYLKPPRFSSPGQLGSHRLHTFPDTRPFLAFTYGNATLSTPSPGSHLQPRVLGRGFHLPGKKQAIAKEWTTDQIQSAES